MEAGAPSGEVPDSRATSRQPAPLQPQPHNLPDLDHLYLPVAHSRCSRCPIPRAWTPPRSVYTAAHGGGRASRKSPIGAPTADLDRRPRRSIVPDVVGTSRRRTFLPGPADRNMLVLELRLTTRATSLPPRPLHGQTEDSGSAVSKRTAAMCLCLPSDCRDWSAARRKQGPLCVARRVIAVPVPSWLVLPRQSCLIVASWAHRAFKSLADLTQQRAIYARLTSSDHCRNGTVPRLDTQLEA